MILNQIERIDYLEIIQTPYSNHFCGKHTTMDDNGGSNKVTGIRQIVRLKGILQKWQHVTIGSRANTPSSSSSQSNGGISPSISRRFYSVYCDSDIEDGSQSPEPPRDVPKGYLAVYVSSELRRFIIPTSYLSDPLFKVLLEKVEEEFGFDHRGGLTIPCEIETFKYLLKCMENHQKGHADENEGEGSSYFATANTTPTHRAIKGTRNCRCVAAPKTTISAASMGDDLATPTGGSTVEINLT